MLNSSRMTASTGAIIALATSNDSRHPPESIIDGNPDTYWITTGGYPQEVIITLPTITPLTSITINCSKVRKLHLEQADGDIPSGFKKLAEKTLTSSHNEYGQTKEFKFQVPIQVKYLKLKVVKGFDHFAWVHSISAS